MTEWMRMHAASQPRNGRAAQQLVAGGCDPPAPCCFQRLVKMWVLCFGRIKKPSPPHR